MKVVKLTKRGKTQTVNMPAHSGPDQHEHGRAVRPKSSGAGRRNQRSRMNVPGSTASGVRKTGKPGTRIMANEQKPPLETEKPEDKDNRKVESEDVEIQPEPEEKPDAFPPEVDTENDVEQTKEEEEEEVPPKPETPPPPPPEPEVFTLEKFNDTVDSFSDVFSQQKFTNVTDEYPVEDLVTLVHDVTGSIEEYKQQTLSSQRHLEDLRERMRDVKERIQTSVQKKTNAIRMRKHINFSSILSICLSVFSCSVNFSYLTLPFLHVFVSHNLTLVII